MQRWVGAVALCVGIGLLTRTSWREYQELLVFNVRRALLMSWNGRARAPGIKDALVDVVQLAPWCIRILGQNPGCYTLQGTNTYLIGTGPSRILIDTGEGKPGYNALLMGVLQAHNVRSISDILVTHGHCDHIGGIAELQRAFPEVRVWKRRSAGTRCPSHISDGLAARLQYRDVEDGQKFATEGAVVRAVATPGHTDDHLAYFAEGCGVLFSGDCILGSGSSCVFQDLGQYMNSLRTLRALEPTAVYPGHGDIITEPVKGIDQYLDHRLQREREVLQQLEAAGPRTVPQLVELIYRDTIPSLLKRAAQNSVRLHLQKLAEEQRVACTPQGMWREDLWAMQ